MDALSFFGIWVDLNDEKPDDKILHEYEEAVGHLDPFTAELKKKLETVGAELAAARKAQFRGAVDLQHKQHDLVNSLRKAESEAKKKASNIVGDVAGLSITVRLISPPLS
eukprot:GHVT01096439.1.p2 GENE.GHVT01096439.1~~GHVT01096439.1.p2  ORF type:complete len:110 (+),score=14.49 GHVT01096439.1:809-1138(+)